MGRAPCCEKQGLMKGPWTSEEDKILVEFIHKNGHGIWRALPKQAGLLRCGKSCRLRWTNYLKPGVKRGPFAPEEERTILQLHALLGNTYYMNCHNRSKCTMSQFDFNSHLRSLLYVYVYRWSAIAAQLPGRTDNELKNFWNTQLKKKLLRMGLDPSTHAPRSEGGDANDPQSVALMRHMSQWEMARLEAEARFSRKPMLSSSSSNEMTFNNNTDTNSNGRPPSDLFLKLWNSEAGEAFRKKDTNNTNNKNTMCKIIDESIPDHEFSRIETNLHLTFSPVSSFFSACSFDQLNSDQLFNDPSGSNQKEYNQYSLADQISDNWIEDFQVNL